MNRWGEVTLYERSGVGGTPWVPVKMISRTLDGVSLSAGEQLALAGGLLAIGGIGLASPEDIERQGIVAIFEQSNGWNGTVTLVQPDKLEGNGGFGRSIALSGERLLVGAPSTTILDQGGYGAAYLFERDASGGSKACPRQGGGGGGDGG